MADPAEVGEFLAKEAQKNSTLQGVIEDARLYDELRENVAWRRLNERVKADKDRFMRGLATRLLAGKDIDPKEVEFRRGFYIGATWILGHPEKAMESLERAATQAYALAQLEYSQEEEETPYG